MCIAVKKITFGATFMKKKTKACCIMAPKVHIIRLMRYESVVELFRGKIKKYKKSEG
jgi:hypothetical protein